MFISAYVFFYDLMSWRHIMRYMWVLDDILLMKK